MSILEWILIGLFVALNIIYRNFIFGVMKQMKCANCGAELKKVDDQLVCAYCGSVYHPDEPEYDDDEFEDEEDEEGDDEVDYSDVEEVTPAPQYNRQENSGKPALISLLVFLICCVVAAATSTFYIAVTAIIIGGIAMCAFVVTFIQFVFRGFKNLFK